MDEPIADEEWLKRYRKEQEEKRRLEEDLRNAWRIECVLVDGKVLTLYFAYALLIIICQNYGQVLTYIRTNYFPCRCTCGNCNRDLLANISECYCCKELGSNWEALTSDIVLGELQEGHVLNCDNSCDNNSLSRSLKFRP